MLTRSFKAIFIRQFALKGIGTLVCLLGCIILFGWLTHSVLLTQIRPGWRPVQFNAGLGFLLCGLGMVWYVDKPPLSLICGLLTFLLGTLTLFEYLFLVDLGLDQFFIRSYLLEEVAFPGRIAPNTALFLSIIGLLLLSRPAFLRPRYVNIIFFALSFFICLSGLVGMMVYLLQIPQIQGLRKWVQMAPMASLAFMLIGLGFLLFLWHTNKLYPLRKTVLLPTSILIFGVLLFFLLWQTLVQHEYGKTLAHLKNQTYFIEESLTQKLDFFYASMQSMLDHISKQAYSSPQEWKRDVKDDFHHFPGLRAVMLLNNEKPITVVNPSSDKKDMDIIQSCMKKLKSFYLDSHQQMILIKPPEPHHLCFTFSTPSEKQPLLLLSLVNIDDIMKNSLQKMPQSHHYGIELWDGAVKLFEQQSPDKQYFKLYWKTSLSFNFKGLQWQIILWPDKTIIREVATLFPLLSLLSGLFMTFLLAFAVYEYQIVKINEKKLKESELILQQYAFYDHLTGLMNRHAFNDAAARILSQAKRHHYILAILFIDLDFFKQINDLHGHNIGDNVLAETAKRLLQMLRKEDLLCRLGGDEFAALLTDIKSKQDAKTIANKIVDQINQVFLLHNHKEIRISASIGIAFYPESGDSISELLNNADKALLQAKQTGKAYANVYLD